MSDQTRCKVPDEMLRAVHEKLWERWGYGKGTEPSLRDGYWANTNAGVEASILWLVGELRKQRNSNTNEWQAGYNVALKDIEEMFVTPFDPSLKGKLSGYTFTQYEANLIKEYIQMSVKPEGEG